MNIFDIKDAEGFKRYVDEAEAELREKNEQIKAAFAKGMMSESERHNERLKHIADRILDMRLIRRKGSFCSDEECKRIEERFETAAGIRRVFRKEHPADLGFDQMEWLSWKYEGVEGIEALWEDKEPLGKTYELELLLKNGDGVARVKYEVRVESVKDELDKNGMREMLVRGHGQFPGYYGEASILVQNIEGRLVAKVAQETKENHEDPIWEKRKPELVDVLVRVDEEMVD